MSIGSQVGHQEEVQTISNAVDLRQVQARANTKAWHPSRVFEPFPEEDIELSIPARFAKTVAAYPDRIALEFDSETMTFTELNNAANVIAHTLIDVLGTEPEPVAMLFDHGMEMIVALIGILKAGKFYVPLSPHDPPGRWEQLLADVEPKVIITDSNNHARLHALPDLCAKVMDYSDFALGETSADPDITITPDAYAFVLFTSGSTGTPKGVIGLHRSVLRFSMHIINQSRLCLHDRTAMLQQVSFSGSLAALYPPLFVGAIACLFDVRKDGLHMLADWFVTKEITFFIGGAIFRAMSEFLGQTSYFPALRVIYGGGGPTYRRHFELFKRITPDTCLYASSLSTTEVSGICRIWLDSEYEPEVEVIPAGYHDEDLEILLWNEDGRPVDPGEMGEIVVRTEYVSPGYWERPELTAERFPEDPDLPGRHVYRTGDLGRFREDGSLVHMGRIDHQVKVRGQRVEIGEVESHLLNMDEISECVVHTTKNDLGVELVGYVVGAQGRPDIQQLRQSLSAVLPTYAVPQKFVVMDALPRLQTGKVDYKSLPNPGRQRPELATLYSAATTELEEQLVQIWTEVLELDSVGVDDRFTDLGGDSLSAVRLLTALEELTGRRLTFGVIAEASTVRELAVKLNSVTYASGARCLVQIQIGGNRQPFFLVPAAASTSISFSQLAKYLGEDQPIYGFDPLGMDGTTEPQDSIESMARLYIQEMRQIQPHGPYYLGGRCFGARPAVEMAYQLEQEGEKVNLVVLLDSGLVRPRPKYPNLRSMNDRWRHLRKKFSPWEILYKTIQNRSRIFYRSLQSTVEEINPNSGDHLDTVFRAHVRARRNGHLKPIHARLVLIVSGEIAEKGLHLGWRQLAKGDFEEYASATWLHTTFLKDTDSLEEISHIIRQEIDAAEQISD